MDFSIKFFYFFIGFFFLLGGFFNESFLNLLISFFILFFTFLVAYSQSIVMSVLSLIALASVFSLTLFGFGVSFLAVLYLAVYIGAVAVFFLFVVMMTDLSDEELLKTKKLQSPNFFSIFLCFLLAFFFNFLFSRLNFLENFGGVLAWDYTSISGNSAGSLNFLLFESNIELIAKLLFKQNVASFIILSLVILVALVGAILLTSSINLIDKHELFFSDLDHLNSVLEEDRFSSFGDGKPQNMDVQLARTTSSSVNLFKAKYF